MASDRDNPQAEVDDLPKYLAEQEKETFLSDDSSEQPPADIVSFNELRSCADLVRMHEQRQLDVKPDFQRDIVWSNAAQTRFIDSLTKQLPIPSMCISWDYKTNRRLVIDGLQRIWSIIQFLTDDQWKLSALDDVDQRISGKKSEYIQQHHPDIIDRIENLTIPITVLRCDYSKKSHQEFLFTIFHRLNTGGSKLANQEIRNCIFSGCFNDFLRETVSDNRLRMLFSLDANETYRYVHEEFILRVLTFTNDFESYDGNLSRFLNDFMRLKRHDDVFVKSSQALIGEVLDIVVHKVTNQNPLPRVSRATSEALFVAIARNIEFARTASAGILADRFVQLRSSEEFRPENLKNALTSKLKQVARLRRAVEVFSANA